MDVTFHNNGVLMANDSVVQIFINYIKKEFEYYLNRRNEFHSTLHLLHDRNAASALPTMLSIQFSGA
ncbi:Terpene cyclase paxA [Trichinella pseudospiralis]